MSFFEKIEKPKNPEIKGFLSFSVLKDFVECRDYN